MNKLSYFNSTRNHKAYHKRNVSTEKTKEMMQKEEEERNLLGIKAGNASPRRRAIEGAVATLWSLPEAEESPTLDD